CDLFALQDQRLVRLEYFLLHRLKVGVECSCFLDIAGYLLRRRIPSSRLHILFRRKFDAIISYSYAQIDRGGSIRKEFGLFQLERRGESGLVCLQKKVDWSLASVS